MTSPARIEANRRNALRSTGPKTPAGKAAAAQNATRHGLFARAAVLPVLGESADEFDFVRAAARDHFAPRDEWEGLIADRAAALLWRQARAARVRAGAEALTAAPALGLPTDPERLEPAAADASGEGHLYPAARRHLADLRRRADRVRATVAAVLGPDDPPPGAVIGRDESGKLAEILGPRRGEALPVWVGADVPAAEARRWAAAAVAGPKTRAWAEAELGAWVEAVEGAARAEEAKLRALAVAAGRALAGRAAGDATAGWAAGVADRASREEAHLTRELGQVVRLLEAGRGGPGGEEAPEAGGGADAPVVVVNVNPPAGPDPGPAAPPPRLETVEVVSVTPAPAALPAPAGAAPVEPPAAPPPPPAVTAHPEVRGGKLTLVIPVPPSYYDTRPGPGVPWEVSPGPEALPAVPAAAPDRGPSPTA